VTLFSLLGDDERNPAVNCWASVEPRWRVYQTFRRLRARW